MSDQKEEAKSEQITPAMVQNGTAAALLQAQFAVGGEVMRECQKPKPNLQHVANQVRTLKEAGEALATSMGLRDHFLREAHGQQLVKPVSLVK